MESGTDVRLVALSPLCKQMCVMYYLSMKLGVLAEDLRGGGKLVPGWFKSNNDTWYKLFLI